MAPQRKQGTTCATQGGTVDDGTLCLQPTANPGVVGRGCSPGGQPIKFAALWANYPDTHPCVTAEGDDPEGYKNQCAIKVSYALEKAGVSLKSFQGRVCPNLYSHGSLWPISAEQLAAWLKKQPFCGCPRPEDVTGEDYETKIKRFTGIIYYRDYWLRPDEKKNPTGDHIDLWNGSRLTASGFAGTIATFLRFGVGIQSGPGFSDLRKAREILFWNIP